MSQPSRRTVLSALALLSLSAACHAGSSDALTCTGQEACARGEVRGELGGQQRVFDDRLTAQLERDDDAERLQVCGLRDPGKQVADDEVSLCAGLALEPGTLAALKTGDVLPILGEATFDPGSALRPTRYESVDGQSPRVLAAWVLQLGYCAPRAEPAVHPLVGRFEVRERPGTRLVAHLTLDGTGTFAGSECFPGSGRVHFDVDLALAP